MKKVIIILSAIFCCFVIFNACTEKPMEIKKSDTILALQEPLVRVRIINTLDEVLVKFYDSWKLKSSGNVFVKNDGINISEIDGQLVIKSKKGEELYTGDSFVFEATSLHGELEIADVPYGVGWFWEGKENRMYEGVISFFATGTGKPEVVVTLPLEEYLKGVVPYEIGPESPIEALKAQAVAARSEAVIALKSNMYNGPNYDLTSDVECQVFSGNVRRSENSDLAVDDTRGVILTNEGEPINAYYASNCGGHSELIKNVWPDRPRPETYTFASVDDEDATITDLSSETAAREWINSKPDVFCNPDNGTELPDWSRNNFRWEKIFTVDSLTVLFGQPDSLGKVVDIVALKRGVSGRIFEAKIIYEHGELFTHTELELRQLFKPSLRSSCFVTEKEGSTITLNGAGWGHGVGMCQSGAVSRATGGAGYSKILNHYYKNAELTRLY